MGTAATTAIAYIVTGEVKLAASIALFDTVFKIAAFYVHERLWHRISFGRTKSPEYQI